MKKNIYNIQDFDKLTKEEKDNIIFYLKKQNTTDKNVLSSLLKKSSKFNFHDPAITSIVDYVCKLYEETSQGFENILEDVY